MPFRSPKMYSFIFGFQRFVWCPKWTPASSRSVIAVTAKLPPFSILLNTQTSTRGQRADRNPGPAVGALPLHDVISTFTELEALARSGHSVFLAFLCARVAREETLVLQSLAELGVVLDKR